MSSNIDSIQLLSLIESLTHPNNTIREESESQLTQLFQTNSPSLIIQQFLHFANDSTLSLTIRQTVLLTMKKVVPLYWSAAFESFVGPVAIDQQVKVLAREQLLNIVFTCEDSKIRNSAIYVIVQIAAVDYPDEWPELIQTLYKSLQPEELVSEGRYLGALALLLDLFDDLITDEQFFGSSGAGAITMDHCLRMISDEKNISDEVKCEAVKVYRTCVIRLQNHPTLSSGLDEDEATTEERAILNEIKTLLKRFISLTCEIINNKRSFNAHNVIYRTTLYNIAFTVLSEFPETFFPEDLKQIFYNLVINDIAELTPEYISIVVNESTSYNIKSEDPHILLSNVMTNVLIELYQCLSSLVIDFPISESSQFESLLQATVQGLLTPSGIRSEYLSDFNPYVTEEFGFAADFSVRNAITEYLGELGEEDMDACFQYLLVRLRDVCDPNEKESLLFYLDIVFRHTGELSQVSSETVTELLQFLAGLLSDEDLMVRARAVLITPSFFQKFEGLLGQEQVQNFGQKLYSESLRVAFNDEGLVKVSSFLASLTYRDFLDFKKLPEEIQTVLFDMIESVLEEADEDTPSLMVEVIIASLEITKKSHRALELILKSAAKDTSNIQLITEVEDAIVSLLKDVDLQTYLSYLQIALPELLATVSMSQDGKYTPQLSLAVLLLTSFMSHAPNKSIPESVFTLVHPVIMELLIKPTTDDQILQYANDTFVVMLQNAPKQAAIDHVKVLGILERFLDPELSDSAAMNVGSLIITIIEKLQQNSQETTELIQQILKATTARLLQAKELNTVENLLSVITYLLTNNENISEALNFLSSVSSLPRILQTWFDHFSTLRGVSKIHENVIALIKIYQSSFEFSGIEVNGDELINDLDPSIIITRSMKAKLQYVKVPVRTKVIKLLIGELKSQITTKEKYQGIEDVVTAVTVNADEEDGEWEDFEDIGNDYEKLKSYVQDDDEEESGEAADNENEKIKELLVQFFKSIARTENGEFKNIYENQLNDFERGILMENIV